MGQSFRLLFTLLAFSSAASFASIPLEYFARDIEYKDVKISPDGKHFAATAPFKNQTILAVIRREDMEPVHAFQFGENQHVDKFFWVNNKRLILTRYKKESWQEQHLTAGQIYAGNIDGTNAKIVFGYQAEGTTGGSRINRGKGQMYAYAEILSDLPDDPDNILISTRMMDFDYDSPRKIYKLNVERALPKRVAITPFGNMNIILDEKGGIQAANGRDSDGVRKVFLYHEDDWHEVKSNHPLYGAFPIAASLQQGQLYFVRTIDNGTEGLFSYDLKTKKITTLFHDKNIDIYSYIFDPKTDELVGFNTMPGYIETHYLNDNSDFGQLHSRLSEAFGKSNHIRVTSITEDLSEIIVYVENDKNAGDFYLFNKEKKTADYLISKKQWLDPALLSDRKPIEFKARDGAKITGYLTLPKGQTKPSPLVTLVHGGPYGVRNTWLYNGADSEEAQMLANNGFAVLQVNFRGSGGFGADFETTAYRKRSTLIQHDIIDGTKWAMGLESVQKGNACIMGWSFGGYSAVMSPLIEPKLFKCSIAGAGVYEAIEQEGEADYSKIDSVAARAKVVYGDNEELLKSESPLTYIDKLEIPILIVHGGKDQRVPPEQAFLLKEALEERKKPFEWLYKPKEGHGFYSAENRLEFYQTTIKFLNKHLSK
ncbi:MAG: S9 family peptidase [Gammaproteobacteria bacterium]|nr:S9 family peptidase [Gammaproteobacteria bacterium]